MRHLQVLYSVLHLQDKYRVRLNNTVVPRILHMRPFAPAMMLLRLIPFCMLLSGVTTFIGCRQPTAESRELTAEAKKFKTDLLAAISGTHRIDLVEHSWRYDFFDEKGELVEEPPHFEYKRMELTPELRTRLQADLGRMPETPKTAFSACIFEPHHTIELIDKDGGKSLIEVCFKCDDTEWDGRSVVPPDAFQEIFRGFIEPLGFQANREWVELAKKQAQQAGAGQPATRPESKSEGSDKPEPEAEGRSR